MSRLKNTLGLSTKFSGGYGLINTNSSLEIAGQAITVEAWILTTGGVATPEILKKDTSYILRLEGVNGHPSFHVQLAGDEQAQSDDNIPVGGWHHVAGTYDGANVKLYVDGILKKTTPATGNLSIAGNPLTVGNQNGGGEEFYGKIDEIRVSKVVRYTNNFTPNREPFVSDSDTILLLHMDEGSGSTLVDSSSNGNNLSLTGSVGWAEGYTRRTGILSRDSV